MAYLAGFFDFLSPLFQTIIKWLYAGIGNYGWTIVLFTVMLKLVTLPLDLWQKISMKKTQVIQMEMAPEIAKINARYGNNKNELNQQQMQCYKRHGFSPIGGCLPLVINMLLVLFIYVSMFNGMNTVSAKITQDQFTTFETVYSQTYSETGDVKAAQDAVVLKYKNDKSTKNGFLWIESISRKDSSVKVFPTAAEYNKMVGEKNKVDETQYNNVMGGLQNEITRWNGYYILPVLVIGISFLSTFLTGLIEKKKTGVANNQTNILMKFLMPTILAVLAFTSPATFGIYLLANSLIALLTGFAIDPIVEVIIKKMLRKRVEAQPKISYSR